MRKRMINIRITSLLIGLLVGCAASFLVLTLAPTGYSGREVFNTEEEYSEFKWAISDSSVEYENEDILVLSSEPPVVVQFQVSVPRDSEFDYGRRQTPVLLMIFLTVLSCGISMLLGEYRISRLDLD